ncbi:hypothetical protein WN55_07435 [Dufourea novaeangliae]|uniref:DUF4817 domain-containing protein n=1 Tax=Dufourea novaeangliae TaxID=178035 RepID=A0A154P4G3_DUFNO|nr:hypothetical protein WN55_07435 [Dufourea novaeangliae]
MVLIYGECHRIMRDAVRVCGEKFPDRNELSLSVFANIIQKFQEPRNVDNKTPPTMPLPSSLETSGTSTLDPPPLPASRSSPEVQRASNIHSSI